MRNTMRWAFAAFLLAGCATASNQSMMITEDTALITRVAVSGQSRDALLASLMNDAAKVTRDHGYRYFVVLDSADASQTYTRKIPGRPITYQNPSVKAFGGTNLSPVYLPGSSFSTPDRDVKETRLGFDVTIRMFRDGAIDPMRDGVWNSDTVLAKNTR